MAWIGRFGNRCHTYLFGKHVEETFGSKFYVPTRWEGSVLFENAAPVIPDSFWRVQPASDDRSSGYQEIFRRHSETVSAYNRITGDKLEFIEPNREEYFGRTNIAFSSLVTDAPWFFPKVSRSQITKYFAFSTELRESEVYRELEAAKGTYDAAHWRRTDIAAANYVGGHSMVSRRSYLAAFEEFECDPKAIEWISDEPATGWKWRGDCPVIGGMRLPWLPDFLKLLFARRLFRSNSAFSTWAGWLGDAEVLSPWLHTYSPGQEIDVRFVKGNHPHWMSVKGAHGSYRFQLKGEPCPEPSSAPIFDPDTSPAAQAESPEPRKQIIMVHWVGRFGNRMFSFAFGRHYAEKFDHDFYIPSEWEGSALFQDQGCKIIEDDELRLRINQTQPALHNFRYRQLAVEDYCRRTNRQLTLINPRNSSHYGKCNVYYDGGCTHSSYVFERYSRRRMLEWFRWSDAVKSLDVYKRLEQIQGTYDIAHLRRDDISSPGYNKKNFQEYSVVSKESYLRAFRRFGFDPSMMEWTTDDWTGKWMPKPQAQRRGGWTYPFGSHRLPCVIFDWLPDFLRLYFARTIFRANSGFSWWAAFLSPCAKVYSPVIPERKIYLNEGDEIECEFVEGNHPHWMIPSSDKGCPNVNIPD